MHKLNNHDLRGSKFLRGNNKKHNRSNLLIAILSVLISISSCIPVGAITVSNEGFDAIEESQVRVFRDKLSISNALLSGNIELSSNFKLYENAGMSVDDYENWDTLRDDEGYVKFANTSGDSKVIAYKGGVNAGANTIPGEVKIRFKDAAITDEGEICDVILTYYNLTIMSQKPYSWPISIIPNDITRAIAQISLNGFSKDEIKPTSGRYENKSSDYRLAFEFDVNFKLVKSGTDSVISKKMTMKYFDLDIYDAYSRATSTPYFDNFWVDRNGNTNPYVESVVLKRGVIDDKIYTLSDNYLKFDITEFGENTWISGTTNTTDENWDYAGFILLVDTSNYEFQVRYNKDVSFYLGFGIPDNMSEIEPIYDDEISNPATDSANPIPYAIFVLLIFSAFAICAVVRHRRKL